MKTIHIHRKNKKIIEEVTYAMEVSNLQVNMSVGLKLETKKFVLLFFAKLLFTFVKTNENEIRYIDISCQPYRHHEKEKILTVTSRIIRELSKVYWFSCRVTTWKKMENSEI
jgi:hypothetical protein